MSGMVQAKFYCPADGSLHMVVTGHAGSAPKGMDLVCAGVSSLVWALGSAVERMYEQGMLRRCPRVEISEGMAEVIAVPKEENRDAVLMAFWTVQTGLAELDAQFGENVRVAETLRV